VLKIGKEEAEKSMMLHVYEVGMGDKLTEHDKGKGQTSNYIKTAKKLRRPSNQNI